jgi:hypothetical protein
LKFEPFDEAEPDEADDIDIVIVNQEFDAEMAAHRAALVHNPFAECTALSEYTPTLTANAADIAACDEVCLEAPDLWLVVGYPFQGQYAVGIRPPSPAGFTRRSLFESIVAVHAAMFEGATIGEHPTLYNAIVESPTFGTAFHTPDDLVLDAVRVGHARDGRLCAWISVTS